MKKFFTCVLIIAIFGIFVFFRGWKQIKVKPDEVGVVISKLGGINEKPIVSGTFSWNKEFLLPTNAELKIFDLTPLNTTKTISGKLPSANIYSSFFTSNIEFNYQITYSISLNITPQDLVILLKQNKIKNSDDLQSYLNNCADSICQMTTEYILKKAENNPTFRVESLRRNDITKNVDFYEQFPNVEISVLAITNSELPDFSLYKKLQTQILENTQNLFNTKDDFSEQSSSEDATKITTEQSSNEINQTTEKNNENGETK